MPLPALRPYQSRIARAVLRSIRRGEGRTFTVEVARQGGKNEVSAWIEAALLTAHYQRGGSGVKCAPTFVPQVLTSMDRLKRRLDDAGFAGVWTVEHGHIVRLGRARIAFYTASPAANVVGATADLLLEVDEAQDVDPDTYQKAFRPMAASANATTVLYGTPWDSTTLLEQQKQANLDLEARDGIRRHFAFDWRAVAASNPAYGAFVEAERHRLGEYHPLFRTQYALQPVATGGGLFSPAQLAAFQGDHPRRHAPEDGAIYVAGVDVAGEAPSPAGPIHDDEALRARDPRRDSTVVTILRVRSSELGVRSSGDPPALIPNSQLLTPVLDIVEHAWFTGRNHVDLAADLAALLGATWRCRRIAVDATGLGHGLAALLARLLGGSVQPVVFTAATKSRLGFALLAAINSNRLQLYAADGSPEYAECREELRLARARYRANQTLDCYVDPRDGHDDFLISLALAVEAAASYAPRTARGRLSTP